MPLPGWDHPILQRRRDAMREAVTSYLPLPAWRELSWAFRTVIVLGLMWLSVAELGTAPGLGLDVLLIAWWWLPAQLSGGARAPAPEPQLEEDLASLVTPVGGLRPYELPFSVGVPPSLR